MLRIQSPTRFLYLLSLFTVSLGVVSLTQNLDPSIQNIRPWFIVSFYLFISFIFNKFLSEDIDKVVIYLTLWYLFSFLSIINASNLDLFFRRLFLNFGLIIVFLNFTKIDNYKLIIDIRNYLIIITIFISMYSIIDIYFFINYNDIFQILHSLDTLSDGDSTNLAYYFNMPRAKAFFNEANEFSVYLSIPFSFLITYIFFNKYNKYTGFYILSLIVVFLSQVLTLSRAGIFAFLFQLILIIFIFKYNVIKFQNIKLLTFIIIFFLFFIFLYSSNSFNSFSLIIDRFITTNTSDDWSINERLYSVKEGVVVFFSSIDIFLFGIGLGALPTTSVDSPTTTNFLLDIFVEYGLFAGFFYVIFLSKIIFSINIFKLNNINSKFYYTIVPLKISLFASILGMIIQGMTYSINTLVFFWIILGYSFSVNKLSSNLK